MEVLWRAETIKKSHIPRWSSTAGRNALHFGEFTDASISTWPITA